MQIPHLQIVGKIEDWSYIRKISHKSCDSVIVRKRPRGERLALPTSDHGVAGSNPAGGEILREPKRRLIAQSLSCLPFHRLEMTEILLKGRRTLTHPSIKVIVRSRVTAR